MAGVETILEKLRTSLGRRGAEGVRGLGRHFKIIDRDNSHTLDAEEFSNCCRINKLGLTKQEEGQLFVAFDKDMSGTVDYEEFLRAVRGRLNPMRKRMVRQIFDALDGINGPDGTKGYLTVANIQPIYSVSNHPQVIAGKMTKQEALQEFLDGFEGQHGNRDGKITLDEWFKYYEELSCSIDKDDYFGMMISNTWHHLKKKLPDGKTAQVVNFTASADVDRLEGLLRQYMYAKVPNDQNTKRIVERAFSDFDRDNSKSISIDEFIKALERFGMHVQGRRPGVGGLPLGVVQALFDKYDADGSGCIDYTEFTKGLFRKDDELAAPPPPPAESQRKGIPSASGKKALCEVTSYLKLSNHIFGPASRGGEPIPSMDEAYTKAKRGIYQ